MSANFSTPLTTQPTSPEVPEDSKTAVPLNGQSRPMDDQASAAAAAAAAAAAQQQQQQQQYPQSADPRSSTFSSSATPTSEYGINPSSARSSSFQEYMQRPGYQHPSGQSTNSTDPSSASATSPTYSHPPYSPYDHHQHHMTHYQGHPSAPPMYGRHEWPSHFATHPMTHHYPHSAGATPQLVSPMSRAPVGGHPGHLSQVYSFVPIPGSTQHKRPRRRYEEIERMYKCGWNGCDKAYGTLNHLNAHVTMQSHGNKRTPEEFKEIRKEWKAKKKEEEAARKAEEERQRQGDGRHAGDIAAPETPTGYGAMRLPPNMGGPQLPPLGYGPSPTGPSAAQFPAQSPGMEGMPQAHYPAQQQYGHGAPMYTQQPDAGEDKYKQ